MWDVLYSFGMGFTIILNLCKFVKVDNTAMPTVIGLVNGLLFSLDYVSRRYIDIATLSVGKHKYCSV